MSGISQEVLVQAALKYQDALTAYAYAILRDWGLAQDAVQEAFVTVSRKWETFAEGEDLLPWVRGIVRFKALNLARAGARREHPCDDEELAGLIDRQFEIHLTEERLHRLERQKMALQRCLDKLDDLARSLLMGFYRDSQSFRELSASLAKSENSLRLHLSRTRKKLRLCADRQLAMET
jgi:RNA polymerase sigma factor (sigma-70 family)